MNIRKIIIPLAGNATRMYPASKVLPKALFPIYSPKYNLCIPIILLLIDEIMDMYEQEGWGLPMFGLIISEGQEEQLNSFFYSKDKSVYREKEFLKEILDRMEKIRNENLVEFILQKEQKGYGHAVYQARQFVGDDKHCIVMLGDHIYTSCNTEKPLTQLLKAFEKHCPKNMTTIDKTDEDHLSINGILVGNLVSDSVIRCTKTIEKPSPEDAKKYLTINKEDANKLGIKKGEYLCYFGIEVLHRDIFQSLEELIKKQTEGEINLRDAQGMMMDEEGSFLGILISGKRHDTGLPFPYHQSQIDYCNHYLSK